MMSFSLLPLSPCSSCLLWPAAYLGSLGRHRCLLLLPGVGLGQYDHASISPRDALVVFSFSWDGVFSYKIVLLLTLMHKIADFNSSLFPQDMRFFNQSRDQKEKFRPGPGWAALIGLAMSIAWLILRGSCGRFPVPFPFWCGAPRLLDIPFSKDQPGRCFQERGRLEDTVVGAPCGCAAFRGE